MLLLRGKLKRLHKMRCVSNPPPPPHPPGAELQNRRGGGLAHSDETDRRLELQLFLGYLPVERDAWERELTGNRSRYAELKDELLANPLSMRKSNQFQSSRTKGEASTSNQQPAENDDVGILSRREVFNGNHPLSLGNGSVWHQLFKDAEIVKQIDRDLLRTHPDIDFFSVDFPCGAKHRDAMRNILLLFAKLNPAIGYVQGMNEVLAPLYYVFRTQVDEQNASNAEADCFGCFVRLLSGPVDHFCQQLDNSSVGIHSTLSRLSELLKANDEELW